MALKNSLLFVFAALTLASASAGAYIVPGNPDRPGGPVRPGNPPPPMPPGRDDFGRGDYGRQEQKVIYLNRHLMNETLHLRQLAGIGENYRGYTVESVIIDVRRSGPRAELALLADGRLEESAYSPRGTVVLRPRYGAVLGFDIRTLQLEVRGQAEIASITINLSEGDSYGRPGRPDRPERPDRPGRPGYGEELSLLVMRRLYGNDRLDLTSYIDMYRYRGYRIEAVQIEAIPVYNTALIDLMINGFNQGQTLQIDRYNSMHTIYPPNAILGNGADSLALYTRGDLEIRRVVLRLSSR